MELFINSDECTVLFLKSFKGKAVRISGKREQKRRRILTSPFYAYKTAYWLSEILGE